MIQDGLIKAMSLHQASSTLTGGACWLSAILPCVGLSELKCFISYDLHWVVEMQLCTHAAGVVYRYITVTHIVI